MENFEYGFVADMDVDIPGRVEKRTYGNPEADKIGPKRSKNVKKIKKPLERHTKTYSPLCDDGKNELIFFKRVSTLKNKMFTKKCNKNMKYIIITTIMSKIRM